VPSEDDEARRQLHQELGALKQDRTRVTNRITSLPATVGGYLKVGPNFGERARRAALGAKQDAAVELVQRLLALRGIGANAAWLFVMELYAWRQVKNRREVGGIPGWVGAPYRSGQLERDQGISKAGNRRVRVMGIQLAWGGSRFSPRVR
jgi:transposase